MEQNDTAVKHILLAEDNPADVYLLKEALRTQQQQFDLTVLQDGEQALDYIDRQGDFRNAAIPDLIILDLNLPKSEGGDVLRRIREHPEFSTTPVIILSSSDSYRDREAAAELGATSYITKPTDLDGFLGLGQTLMRFIAQPERSANSI